MGDILKGFQFSGSSPNNQVTAGNLNNLVDNATVQPTLISAKPAYPNGGTVSASDQLLILQGASNTLQRVAVSQIVPQSAVRAGVSGLYIENQFGTSNTVLALAAREISFRSSVPGSTYYTGTVTGTIDVTTTGVGGRESGITLTSGTWYSVWAISDGTNVNFFLSAAYSSTSGGVLSSATFPTLPTPYTLACLLGFWLYTPAGLYKAVQVGNQVYSDVVAWANDTTTTAFVPIINSGVFSSTAINGTAGNASQVNLQFCVPYFFVNSVQGIIGETTASTGGNYVVASYIPPGSSVGTSTYVNPSGPYYGCNSIQLTNTVATRMLGFYASGSFDVGIFSNQVLYVASTSTAARHSMRITGFTLAL
jgi:hypothetical protein